MAEEASPYNRRRQSWTFQKEPSFPDSRWEIHEGFADALFLGLRLSTLRNPS